jgi:hypothetical protein
VSDRNIELTWDMRTLIANIDGRALRTGGEF